MRTKKLTTMDKQKALELAEELTPLYERYKETKRLSLSMTQSNLLKQLWEKYLMGTNLNTTCPTCIAYALTVVYTWYNREAPKVSPIPQQELVEDIKPVDDIKPIIKKRPGRPKKNK